ncbi:hypothetical protein D1007_20504 [Hordeum vulgare]|nr:hypothetical protein D1007_20504 [Hordeum vulgare]
MVGATDEFTKKSAKQSELQKKTTHPHHMGVAGYYDMKLIWNQEDKEEVVVGGKPTFTEIRGECARDYVRAHARRHDDGTYYFENSRDEELYRVMLKASKISGRFYRNSGSCDILSNALETKQPLAVQREIEESVMMQKTLALTDSQQMGGDAGIEDAGYYAIAPHKNRCASADPSNNETATTHDDVISHLFGMNDTPRGMLTHYEGLLAGDDELRVRSPGLPTEEMSRVMAILLGSDPGDLPDTMGPLYRIDDWVDVIIGLSDFDERGLLPAEGPEPVEVAVEMGKGKKEAKAIGVVLEEALKEAEAAAKRCEEAEARLKDLQE